MWETGGRLHAVEDVVVAPLRPKVSGSKAAAGLTAVASVAEWPVSASSGSEVLPRVLVPTTFCIQKWYRYLNVILNIIFSP